MTLSKYRAKFTLRFEILLQDDSCTSYNAAHFQYKCSEWSNFQVEDTPEMKDRRATSYGQALQYLDRQLQVEAGQTVSVLLKRDGSEVGFPHLLNPVCWA